MNLFETVQLELFEFMGFKKRDPRPSTVSLSPKSFEQLPCDVELVRKKNLRGLRFRVNPKGVLEISANKSTDEAEIFSLLKPHLKWITQQVEKAKERHILFPQKKWQSGERFLWSGKPFEMVLSPSSTKKPHIRFMNHSFEYFYPTSWQELSPDLFHEKLHASFLYFFKLKASETLNEKVDHWSKEMNLFPKSVSYRNQKTRWGSCSSEGRVNLNWKLACFEPAIQDYVVIHELAHLKHQDHSKNFWKLVEIFSPNRKKLSQDLHKISFEADCFASSSELYKRNPDFKTPEL